MVVNSNDRPDLTERMQLPGVPGITSSRIIKGSVLPPMLLLFPDGLEKFKIQQ